MYATKHNIKIRSLAKNINYLLGIKKMSISELSKVSGVIYMTTNRIVNGQTTDPKISNLLDIANALKVSIDTLVSDNNFLPDLIRPVSIPLVGIKDLCYDLDNIVSSNVKQWVISNINYTPADVVIALSGKDIASTLFPNECVIIISKLTEPENSNYVLADIDGKGVSLKLFNYDPPKSYVTSFSPNNKHVFEINENNIIVGVGIETILNPVLIKKKE